MQTIHTPAGETLVVLPLDEYERLIDAADVNAAKRVREDIDAGRDELVPAAVVNRIVVDGENPIRVWREHRGFSASEVAARAGISAGYFSEIETGKKPGGVAVLSRIAAVLGVAVDDLI